MPRQLLYVGFESANSYIKAVGSESNCEVDVYLNTLTESTKEDYDNQTNGLAKTSDAVYEVEGNYFKVGKKPTQAKKQGSSSSSNITRYKSPSYRWESLIAIFRQVENVLQDNAVIRVVTGVPTDHAVNPDAEKFIQNNLCGKHKVNGKELYIASVDVISQGESTFYSEVFNDKAGINEEFVLEISNSDEDEITQLLYIDIGHGTTDYRVVSDFSTYETENLEVTGISEVWNELLKFTKERFPKISAKKPTVLALEKDFQTTGKFEYKLIDIDISEKRDELLQKYANQVINEIYDTFREITFDQIRITGGGAIALEKYLLNSINQIEQGDKKQRERYVLLNKDIRQKSNALGYLRYCYYIHNN
jgi:hypothetical protein